MNHLTDARHKSKQLVVLDTTNSGGLFSEDYIDILMLTQPHSLITHLVGPSANNNKKLVLTSTAVTRTFINTILYRENYLWKRPLIVKPTATNKMTTNQTAASSQRVNSHVVGQDESTSSSVLDLFDTKYSNPVLSIQDAHDIFYAGHVTNQSGVDDLTLLMNKLKSKKR